MSAAHPSLRPLVPADASRLAEAVRELATSAYGPSAGWATPTYGLDDAHRFLRGVVRDRQALLRETWAVEQGEEFLGLASLKNVDWVHGCAQVGYWLRPAFWRQGVGTQMLAQLGEAAAGRGLQRLEFLIRNDNAASLALAKRCGARQEGLLRNRLLVEGRRYDAVLLAWCLGPTGAEA